MFSDEPVKVPSSPDQRQKIDTMADYVARYGLEFEQFVRTENEKQFNFLKEDHIFHNYYVHRKYSLFRVSTSDLKMARDSFMTEG